MDLSILIVTYNSAALMDALLGQLHAEIHASGFPWKVEVVLVDNASADGTAAWVQARHPWVRCIRSHTIFFAITQRLDDGNLVVVGIADVVRLQMRDFSFEQQSSRIVHSRVMGIAVSVRTVRGSSVRRGKMQGG